MNDGDAELRACSATLLFSPVSLSLIDAQCFCDVRWFRLDRDAVILHIAVVCSAVGRLHSNVRSSRLPRQRSARHGRADDQLHGVVVREDPGMAVPHTQPHVRLRIESHLHGVVARYRRLLSERPQISRSGHQHPAVRISNRSVWTRKYIMPNRDCILLITESKAN